MSEYVKFDLRDKAQIEAFASVLDEHLAEERLHIGTTARGEVFIGAKTDSDKLKCMHYIGKDGCVKTAWSDVDGKEVVNELRTDGT